jgi:hypothetical protein
VRLSRRVRLIASVLVVIIAAVTLSRVSRATPHVRDEVVKALNDRFDSEVELDSFQVSVFPRPEIDGSGLKVKWDGRSDVSPIVQIGTFHASAGAYGLLTSPVRLRTVELDRLDIYIPPDGLDEAEDSGLPSGATHLVIDEIISRAARLQIVPRNPAKLPRVFDIHDLKIFGYGTHDGADFQAILTNPIPDGRIETKGRFGPWQTHAPQATPVRGEYTFTNADMNTIDGLAGTLSSRGAYHGVLERIEVSGDTSIPDFSIDIARRPVPLTTHFKAVVDGTNGDTVLEQVDARLFDSHIHAKGAVVRTKDVKGRRVTLDVAIDNARIEDLLNLAVKSQKPPLTGAVKAAVKFVLPAGKVDVIRKLRLDGDFALDGARFTSFNVQKRINTLSRKGSGDDGRDDAESVVSNLRGRFALRDGTLSFSNLTFAVPGAIVQLVGTYQLEREVLDFTGQLLLDASLRETTSGFKQALAVLAQPFFGRKGGGSRIPIHVRGTREKPEFGLDVRRALLPG